jgi:WD40 repeat protein
MSQVSTCPDTTQLKDLLDGNLPDQQQLELNSHLENCPACQQNLESLAAGKETWSGAAEKLSDSAETPEAGLRRVIEASKKDAQSATEAEAPVADVPLDFLDPPQDPGHLGRLGHYEVLEVIGRGGMGIVLKAFDASLHRVVAIKVLAPQLATTAAARSRFEREGKAAAAVGHEHVVAIYGVDEVRGLPYLVMEYIAGVSLQERLDRSGPLELKEVLRIGMQTAHGLAAAHAQGLVHRDIKPANILLHNGVARVKITDFGLARAVDDATLTQSGYVAGTPQYMSPEQARGDAIDLRTDLFSLGSVLYAMCTGRPPFRASTTMGVLKRVSEESARDVREVNPEVPPWLADIIARLHAKSPAERFQSAAEVAELLGRHLSQLQQASPPATPVVSVPAPAPAAASQRSGLFRKRPWAIAAALLPVLAGMFVVTEATGVTNVTEFMATVLRIHTRDGTLVIETDDPGVEVIVDGGEITIHGAGPKEIRVKPGEHRIRASKDGKEVPVDQELVTVTRGGRQIVRIRRENPKQVPGKLAVPPVHGLPVFAHVATLNSRVWHIRSLVFAPDGKTLASAGIVPGNRDVNAALKSGGIIELWDLTTNKSLWLWKDPSPIGAAAFSPGSTTLASGGMDGTLRLRNVDRGDLIKILHAGTGPVNAVAFAADGQTLAVGNADLKVRIVRVGTREILERFESGNSQSVLCLAYSPDGKTLAVAGSDRPKLVPRVQDVDGNISKDEKADISTVRLFEVGSWKLRTVLAGHHGAVTSLVFSPDGKLLATAGVDHTTKLWNVADGKEVATLDGHTARVNVLAFSPDGTLLISGGHDKTVKLWDVIRRKLLLSSRQDSIVHSLALSPDGKTLAIGGTYEIKLWNIGSVYAQAPLRQRLATLRESAARVEALYKQGAASVGVVLQARLDVLKAELDLCESPGERIAVYEKMLAHRREIEKRMEALYKSGAAAEDVLLQARAERQDAEIALQRERARATPPHLSPRPLDKGAQPLLDKSSSLPVDKAAAALAKQAEQAHIDTLKKGFEHEMWIKANTIFPSREIATLREHEGVIWSIAFAPDGKTLVSAGGGPGKPTTTKPSGEIKLWDIATRKELWSAKSPSMISAVAFSPGGTTLASAEADGRVQLREADSGWGIAELRRHEGPVYTVAFAANGQTLASSGLDHVVRIWRVGTRELLESFDGGNTRLVQSLAFSPDGKLLAVGGHDQHLPGGPVRVDPQGNVLNKKRYPHTARLFEVGSWKVRAVLSAHDGPIEHIAFSRDSKLLATASSDKTVRLWDPADGKELATLKGHTSAVRGVAFSPDGTLLASAGEDGIVFLWDVARREIRGILPAHRGKLFTVAFSPDGKTLAGAGSDRTIKLWDIAAVYTTVQP